MHRERFLQFANIERSLRRRRALIKQDQRDEQNETAEREINCDFPRRANAISRSPNSDEQKRRDQRELVESVEEKQIDRCESANGACGNEKEAGVKRALAVIDLTGEPNCRDRDNRRE